jgi:hypothetical protein
LLSTEIDSCGGTSKEKVIWLKIRKTIMLLLPFSQGIEGIKKGRLLPD